MAWTAVSFDDAAKARIKAAADLECNHRLESYVLKSHDLGWCDVRAITPRDCIIFELDENKLFSSKGEKATVDDYIHFAFILKTNDLTGKKFVKNAALNFKKNLYSIDKTKDFINLSFVDCPKSESKQGESVNTGVWLASLVDCLASEYGWGIDQILDTPIKILFLQMQQIYCRRLGKKNYIRNPITQIARASELRKAMSNA